MFGGGFTTFLRSHRWRPRDDVSQTPPPPRRLTPMNGTHPSSALAFPPRPPPWPGILVHTDSTTSTSTPTTTTSRSAIPMGSSGKLSVSSLKGGLERAGSCCETQGPSPRLKVTTQNEKALSVDNTAGGLSPRPRLRREETIRPSVFHSSADEYVQLNHYKLMGEIGQGSYGIVKLAYNERDQTHYAMKILDKAKLIKKFAFFRRPPSRGAGRNAPDPLAQVNREIAILKKLSHPNVVKLMEVLDDQDDNYLYMVFEYLERGSVLEMPTEHPLSEDVAWRYFRDTLLGLEYLHFQKIVHRDIKPSNLLLTESDRVKIADFGVSAEFEGLDAFLTGTAGSPAFMAPEALLIEDSAHFYSGRAQDIWSLGITLFSFLYGNVPFWDTYIIALHRKIKTDPLIFPDKPKVSSSVKRLIEKMLAKDPGFRLILSEIKADEWVTKGGTAPLEEFGAMERISVTEAEIATSVRVVPSLDTLILIKAMGQRKRFGNPFKRGAVGDMGVLPMAALSLSEAVSEKLRPSRAEEMAELVKGSVGSLGHKLARANTLQD